MRGASCSVALPARMNGTAMIFLRRLVCAARLGRRLTGGLSLVTGRNARRLRTGICSDGFGRRFAFTDVLARKVRFGRVEPAHSIGGSVVSASAVPMELLAGIGETMSVAGAGCFGLGVGTGGVGLATGRDGIGFAGTTV